MKTTALIGLVALTLAPRAVADVHSRTYFVFDQATSAWASAHLDYDDVTGELSAWVDYNVLVGTLLSVDVESSQGSLVSLTHEGGNTGFAFGSATIDAAGELALESDETQFVFRTTAAPAGELFVSAFFGFEFTREATLTPGQVTVPSSSLGVGSVFLTADPDGTAQASGFASGLDGTITSVEIRGPAYFGQTGPVIASTNVIGNNGFSDSFFIEWTPADAQALAKLKDGFVYVLVKTDAFPDGEIRGQIGSTSIGEYYCPGRPNSVGFNGGGLSATGSPLAADQDLTLSGVWLPKGKPVLPIVGLGTGHLFNLPGSAGTLCVGGGPFVRLSANIGMADPVTGTFSTSIGLAGLPFGAVQPGDVLNFQLWYRDVVAQSQTTNLSNALSIRYH